jgi:hypothetical protein
MKLILNASCFCIKLIESWIMMSMNKWNQWENYSDILMVDFHVMSQIIDYPLKLMEIFLMTLGLFMARYDET